MILKKYYMLVNPYFSSFSFIKFIVYVQNISGKIKKKIGTGFASEWSAHNA